MTNSTQWTTAADLQPITLTAAQVNRVNKHGSVELFDVFERQPIDRWNFMYSEQTRAVFCSGEHDGTKCDGDVAISSPFAIGERLWVKERWRYDRHSRTFIYRADYDEPDAKLMKWMRASQMPIGASRLTLETVSVSPVQIQDVSGEDANTGAFGDFWDATHPAPAPEYKWDKNPWWWMRKLTKVKDGDA